MSYNRWMPVRCSSELYHHGVKGMKWGKHLFGKGVEIQSSGGGGGGNEEQKTYDKSLAKIADKITGKKRELSFDRPLLSQDATNKGTRTKLQNRRKR